MMRLIAFAFAALAVLASASAQSGGGMVMQNLCDWQSHPFIGGIYRDRCSLTILGEADGLEQGENIGRVTMCVPAGVSAQQIVLVVKRFMANHPEALNLEMSAVVARALSRAWPCR